MTKSLPTDLCWLTILDNWYSTTLRLKASNLETVAVSKDFAHIIMHYTCVHIWKKQPLWNGSAIIALRPRLSDCFCFFQYLNWQYSLGWRHTEAWSWEKNAVDDFERLTSPLSFIVERLPCFSASSIYLLTFCLLYFFHAWIIIIEQLFPIFSLHPGSPLFGFLLPPFPIFIRFLRVLIFLELSFLRAREAWDYSQTLGPLLLRSEMEYFAWFSFQTTSVWVCNCSEDDTRSLVLRTNFFFFLSCCACGCIRWGVQRFLNLNLHAKWQTVTRQD